MKARPSNQTPKKKRTEHDANRTRVYHTLNSPDSNPQYSERTKHPLLTLTVQGPYAGFLSQIRSKAGTWTGTRAEKIRSEIRAGDSTAEQNCRVRSPVAGRDLISQPR
jgi:hypothetical protein